MLRRAPQDAVEISNFASAVRSLSRFKMPDPTEGWGGNWLTYLPRHTLPAVATRVVGYEQ